MTTVWVGEVKIGDLITIRDVHRKQAKRFKVSCVPWDANTRE